MPPVSERYSHDAAVSPALREALASSNEAREFVAADPARSEAPCCVSARVADTQVAKVADYFSELLNGEGRVVRGRESISIEERPEDVVDVVAYYEQDGKIFVATTEVNRPALFAREARGLDVVVEQKTGRMINLPGGYITEDGVSSAVRKVVAQKIGTTILDEPFRLGGAILPNAGSSPEVAIPFAVRVRPPVHSEMASYGDKLDSNRLVRFMDVQSIVDAYYEGRLHDPRLLEGALRLAEHLEIEIKLPFGEKLRGIAQSASASEVVAKKILTPEVARNLLRSPPPDSDIVSSVRMTAAESAPENPFLERYRLWIANIGQDGKQVGANYEVDAVVRALDTLNVGCFSLLEGEPLLAVNIGAREALERRESEVHVMHIATEARTMEGVTGSILVGANDQASLQAAARRIAEQHTGIDSFGDAVALDTYGFWSPGFNTSLYRESLIPFDASQVTSVQSTTYFVRARDILELAKEGVVRDLALIQHARRLDAAFPTERKETLPQFSPELKREYSELVNADAPVMQFIREHAPHLRELLKTSPLFAGLLAARINQGGIVIEKPQPGSLEAMFFSSHMETYLFHPEMPGAEAAAFLLHDGWHFGHEDKLPFYAAPDGTLLRDAAGNPLVCTAEQYGESPSFNEVDALTFSEVVIPIIYGIDEYEKAIGTPCVAGLLRGAGIRGFDEQRAAVREMAAEGRLPEKVAAYLSSGDNFARYERLLHERLIGFYVRDVVNNVPQMYRAWSALPEVAEVAIRLGARAYNDGRKEPETFSERLHEVTQGSRAINQLQAAISSTCTQEIYCVALDIAYLAHLATTHAQRAVRDTMLTQARAQIAELISAHDTLSEILPTIRDTEHSERNLNAFEKLRDIKNGVCRRAAEFLKVTAQDADTVGAMNVQELAGRKYMAFPLIPFGVPEELKGEVPRLIAESFQRLGLPVPSSRSIVSGDGSGTENLSS